MVRKKYAKILNGCIEKLHRLTEILAVINDSNLFKRIVNGAWLGDFYMKVGSRNNKNIEHLHYKTSKTMMLSDDSLGDDLPNELTENKLIYQL